MSIRYQVGDHPNYSQYPPFNFFYPPVYPLIHPTVIHPYLSIGTINTVPPSESNTVEPNALEPESNVCEICSKYHASPCPYIESIEYYENGEIKKMTFWSQHGLR